MLATTSTADNVEHMPSEPVTKKLKTVIDADQPIPLLIKKVGANAHVPTRGSEKAAGWDLYRYLVLF